MTQRLISTALIVLSWFILDMVFHAKILMADYMATAQLWRPAAEMSPVFSLVIAALAAIVFVLIYCRLVSEKTMKNGLKLGLLVGLLTGIYFGVGSYAYMPITTKIAAVWGLASLVKFTVAGAIAGKFVTESV